MSAAKRKRVAGDAERARMRARFKDAARKAFSHEQFSRGRAVLDAKSRRECDQLPFVHEFSSFPVLLRAAGRCRCVICVPPVTPLSVDSMTRAFLERADAKSFFNWYVDPRMLENEREIADERLVSKMNNTLEAIKNARAASLHAFCAAELDALTKARDACVARMMEWDAADVDVEKFIATLDD